MQIITSLAEKQGWENWEGHVLCVYNRRLSISLRWSDKTRAEAEARTAALKALLERMGDDPVPAPSVLALKLRQEGHMQAGVKWIG